MASDMALTEPQRRYLVGLLKIGRGSVVAIDKALPAAGRRDRRELVEARARFAADVERLEAVLIRG